jgi:hypothetical protein
MATNGSSRAPLPVALVQGLNGTGGCILTEVKVNDKVLGMQNIQTLGMESTSFETTVTVAGQIQQTSSSNLSGNQYWAYIAVQS